jgi:hypothetical protein
LPDPRHECLGYLEANSAGRRRRGDLIHDIIFAGACRYVQLSNHSRLPATVVTWLRRPQVSSHAILRRHEFAARFLERAAA